MKAPVRAVLLGFGAVNSHVAELLRVRKSPVRIVGVIRRSSSAQLEGVASIRTPEELLAVAPELVLEAASREAVREWGEPALRAARRFVVSSASAFTDEALLASLRTVARDHDSQLVLSSGAIAGVEALAAAARRGLSEVRHRIIKHPDRWGQASSVGSTVIFRGSAREAAAAFPLNANVTVVSALAGLGLDRTTVELIADSGASQNRHEIHAQGDFGSLEVVIQNRSLPSNQKSSELAALALVRVAENQSSDLVL